MTVPSYRVPVLIKGHVVVKYPDGKCVGDYIGGLPRDAEAEVGATAPFMCGARMVDYTVEVAGPALLVERTRYWGMLG
jgi:hypothetical protein